MLLLSTFFPCCQCFSLLRMVQVVFFFLMRFPWLCRSGLVSRGRSRLVPCLFSFRSAISPVSSVIFDACNILMGYVVRFIVVRHVVLVVLAFVVVHCYFRGRPWHLVFVVALDPIICTMISLLLAPCLDFHSSILVIACINGSVLGNLFLSFSLVSVVSLLSCGTS